MATGACALPRILIFPTRTSFLKSPLNSTKLPYLSVYNLSSSPIIRYSSTGTSTPPFCYGRNDQANIHWQKRVACLSPSLLLFLRKLHQDFEKEAFQCIDLEYYSSKDGPIPYALGVCGPHGNFLLETKIEDPRLLNNKQSKRLRLLPSMSPMLASLWITQNPTETIHCYETNGFDLRSYLGLELLHGQTDKHQIPGHHIRTANIVRLVQGLMPELKNHRLKTVAHRLCPQQYCKRLFHKPGYDAWILYHILRVIVVNTRSPLKILDEQNSIKAEQN